MASTYLTHTTSTPTNNDKCTISFWIKFSNVGSDLGIFSQHTDSNNRIQLARLSSGALSLFQKVSSSIEISITTNKLFRDVSSWYHVVIAFDTTQSTASDRVKFYVNGVQETSFSVSTYPSQNTDIRFNSSSLVQEIGRITADTYMNGSMSHVHFIDGTAYDASAFGQTDTTTGEWRAKTSPSVTYGTNGFFILKDGNSVTDSSSNSNAFTVSGGTLTDLKDNPDNVFATLNALDNYYQVDTLSNGNLTMVGGGQYAPRTATLGLTTGKWYWEILTNNFQSSDQTCLGISSEVATAANYEFYNQSGNNVGYGYFSNGSGYGNGGTIFTSYGSASGTHTIGVAIDLDNNKIAWSYDGTWQGSANPSNGTNMISITAPSSLATGTYFPAFTQKTNTRTLNVNFGNGYFGTTAITTNSGNGYSGAEGSSKFNQIVPTGYSAVSTKGLNE